MLFRFLAGAVVTLHLGFVLFVALGGLLVRRWRRLAWAHLAALAWGVWIELSGGICPLTPLENRLRRLGGEAAYGGDFVGHYLLPMLYPEGLDRGVQAVLAAAVLGLNAAVYWRVLRRPRSGKSEGRSS
ncbi:MAG TPA: DUF2784 domain-containing protein [Thermoanaerobaculia bacterium]|nr:DUF2784 domain-containing protein [Thermoanaerobaculia bacterium]